MSQVMLTCHKGHIYKSYTMYAVICVHIFYVAIKWIEIMKNIFLVHWI